MSQDKTFRTIDAATLPKHFDAPEAEKRWDETWEKDGIHRYDPTRPRNETFAVDTPPPTVSGSLHVGHVFSYTHTDVTGKKLVPKRTQAQRVPVQKDIAANPAAIPTSEQEPVNS